MAGSTRTPVTNPAVAAGKCLLWGAIIGVAVLLVYRGGIRLVRALSGSVPQQTQMDRTLVIAAHQLDLGRVYEADVREHTFQITNASDRPVTIDRFYTTCDCLGITPGADVTLDPQETRPFTIKLLPTVRTDSWSQPDGEPQEVYFGAVYTTGGQDRRTAEWRLHYVVVPTIRLASPVVRLGTQSVHQAFIEQAVECAATEAIARIECEAPLNWSVEAIRQPTAVQSNRFNIIVRSQGKLLPRKVADVVRLYPVDRDGNRLPSRELKVEGDIVWDVVSTPPGIHHGRQTCGTVAEAAIQLHSLTNRRFQVKSVDSSWDDLTITPLPDMPVVYTLRLKITQPGDQEAVALFTVQDEEGVEFAVAVSVRYHGTGESVSHMDFSDY